MTIQNINITLLTELQCIGNIYYWSALVKFEYIKFEQYEQFQKAGFRNRYQILSASGPLTLSIPVVGGRENKKLIREVSIDNSAPWQSHHWRGLESCYNKSAFFFHYQHMLQPFYERQFKWLWDFNIEIFEVLCKLIKVQATVEFTNSFLKEYPPELVHDLRNRLKIANRLDFGQLPYPQVFGAGFEQNLSLFDLLFNLGPNSTEYLSKQGNL